MSTGATNASSALAAWLIDNDQGQIESALSTAIEVLEEWPDSTALLASDDPPTDDQVNEARCVISEIRHVIVEAQTSGAVIAEAADVAALERAVAFLRARADYLNAPVNDIKTVKVMDLAEYLFTDDDLARLAALIERGGRE